jgi:hypothetical protein
VVKDVGSGSFGFMFP